MTTPLVKPAKAPALLVVDDHAGMRASLATWLTQIVPQCRLIEAASGESAVQLALSSAIDLVLMDLNMPGMGGIEATRRIRDGSPATRVLILTMHDGADYRAAAAAAGASGFVSKLSMHRQLPPMIRAVLGAAAPSAASA
jgi:two-component system invasion response regulator UvrY